MRSRLRGTLLALSALSVLAVAGAASSTASAAICHESEHGGTVGLCVEKALVTGQLVPFTGTRKTGTAVKVLQINGGGNPVCEVINTSGTFNTTGLSLAIEKLKIEFSKCEVTGSPTKCEMRPFTLESSGSFSGENTGAVTLKGALTKGEKFGEAAIVNRSEQSCAFSREGAVVGSMKCRLPHSEEELATHELQCLASEGAVHWTGLTAPLEFTENVKLESSKLWGLMVS